MGDPFSIAVGALQVAEVGFKLCDTLHSSVRDFKNAEKDVKRVASEVKTASWALKQLGALLQQDEAIKRTRPGAISEASTALNQCSEAFAEVQVILPASGSSTAASISAATRFKWATRKSKVDALLANLERLKTTLVLVFKVISYAKEIACSSKDTATDQMDMRFQLETLIKSKDEAVRRYEQLVKSLNQTGLEDDSTNALGLDSGSKSLNARLNVVSLPSNHALPTQSNANVKSPVSETDTGNKNCENRDLTKRLTEALADCDQAASGLSECLHIVHIQWRAVQKYDGDVIWKYYRLTDNAMRALEVVQAKSLKANLSQSHAQSQAQQQQHAQGQAKPIGLQKEKQKVSTVPQDTGASDATEGSIDTMDPSMINIDYASPTIPPADPTRPTEGPEEFSTPPLQISSCLNRELDGWQAWMVSSPLKDKTVPTQPRKRKRKANPGETREQRATKKGARNLAAKAAAECLSGDNMESDTSRDPKRPLGENEVRPLIGAYERDHGESKTASHRKTDGNVAVSITNVPSANDGVTPGRLCNSQKGLHLPPLTLPDPPARRNPALRMQVPGRHLPGRHLPTREDVDPKLMQCSYEKPEDFEKPIDADTEDPVDALLREWTTIQVC